MAGKVPMRPISDGASVYSGFAFKSEDFTDAGIPVVKIKNVNNRLVDLTDSEFFPAAKVTDKHTRFFLKDRDVLIAMTGQGSVGRVGRVRLTNIDKVLLNQRVGKFVTDPHKLDLDYLFYIISTPRYAQILFDAGSGSGQPNLSPQIICSVQIPFPPLAEQKAIAKVLCALDDKIELNRRMNATLEAMSRALFQSWFLDFDPVRAKLDGRQPAGMDEATAALFPDSFDHIENDQMRPKGWVETTIGDEVDFQTGFPFRSTSFSNTPPGVRLARGMNVKEGSFYWSSEARFWPEVSPDIEGYLLKAGDTLIGMDGSKVGKNWVRVRSTDLPCLLVQRVARLRAASSLGENFISIIIGSTRFRDFVDAVKTGTSIPHISGGQIRSFEFVRPPIGDNRIFKQFEKATTPLTAQLDKNHAESQILEALRDVLFPKLLSGELPISSLAS